MSTTPVVISIVLVFAVLMYMRSTADKYPPVETGEEAYLAEKLGGWNPFSRKKKMTQISRPAATGPQSNMSSSTMKIAPVVNAASSLQKMTKAQKLEVIASLLK